MAPDLNSLPASPQAPTQLVERPRRISFNNIDSSRASPPSPRSPPVSNLQAAATINAGLQRTVPSPGRTGIERRRSSLLNSSTLGESVHPSETHGSTASSRRGSNLARVFSDSERPVSLGELHQELENEQEAQVNRLLHMIRLQQDQLAALARGDTEAIEAGAQPLPPQTLSRQSSTAISSHTASRVASPALRPLSATHSQSDEISLGTRDDSAFYQAETQSLTRENQMLKHRIRELERQIAELTGPASSQAEPGAAS